MIVFPNCKINIGLNIVSRRADGYHNLETIFFPIGIKDVIEFTENGTDKVSFTSGGISLDCNSTDNLVVKAYNLIKSYYPVPGLDIELVKNIPTGAGLGGGSSDATATLMFLNQHYSLGISDGEMQALASKLGADCAFFVENRPVYATGIGDIMTPIDLSLKGYYILVVKPDVFISTKEAFAGVVPKESEFPLLDSVKLPIEEWKNFIKNDFEKSIFSNHRDLQNVKSILYDTGAFYASMSGSGSSFYGFYKILPDNVGLYFKNCYIWSSLL